MVKQMVMVVIEKHTDGVDGEADGDGGDRKAYGWCRW